MWGDLINWWQSVLADPTIIGGALAGLIAALVMFLVSDVLWKTRMEKIKIGTEFRQKQLDKFYAPLYGFYREAYRRYDFFKEDNPDTVLERQPFFESGRNEDLAERIFSESPGYSSQELIRLQSNFRAAKDIKNKDKYRDEMISTLVKEYHQLRRKLRLDYDKDELKSGNFRYK